MSVAPPPDAVVWHDVECGSYAADLPLWRELAAAARGPVLDVGAGTGRVAIDLAQHGHEVHALDVDPALLDALADRARTRGLQVTTHAADARDFDLGKTRFHLIIAPMQTVQLLGDGPDRARFLRAARRHLALGGLLAVALANVVEGFGEDEVDVTPDLREVAGVVYASRPTAIRDDGEGFVLERLREKVDTTGRHEVAEDRIRLARVTPERLLAEGAEHGFRAEPTRVVEATEDHVGSEVAMLRG